MKDILINIIGSYIPFESEGIASLDIPWIFSALLFTSLVVIVTWSFTRLIIGVLHD